MRRNIVMLGIVFFLGLSIGTILQTPQTAVSPPGITPAKEAPRRYAFNAAYASIPIWTEPRQTWLALARSDGSVQTEFGGPSTGDSTKQIEELENLIAQKVDGIALFPGDPKALGSVIDKAVRLGIPVVTTFADVAGSKRVSSVHAIESSSARQILEQLITEFPRLTQEKSKIVLSIANPAIDTQQERMKGIREIVNLYPPLEIAMIVNDDIDEKKAAEALHAALVQHPDTKVIVGLDSRSAIGAVSALRELGKAPGDVLVTGWDSDVDVLAGIKSGWIHSTVALPYNFMMELSYAVLEAYYLNFGSVGAKEKNMRDIPDHIDVPSTVISLRNVDEYLK